MKAKIVIISIAVLLGLIALMQPRKKTNISEKEVIEIVQKGTANGKSYKITKKDNGLFDLREF